MLYMAFAMLYYSQVHIDKLILSNAAFGIADTVVYNLSVVYQSLNTAILGGIMLNTGLTIALALDAKKKK